MTSRDRLQDEQYWEIILERNKGLWAPEWEVEGDQGGLP